MMTRNDQQAICQLNVEGLLAMQQNEYGKALAFFQRCLTILLQGQSLSRDDARSSTGFLESDLRVPASESFCQQHQNRMVVSIALPASNHSEREEEIFTLFNRAFHLQFNERGTALTDSLRETLSITAISYNVGLTHHIAGLKQGNSRMMLKALDYYSMAYTALTNAPEHTASEAPCVSVTLCRLAIVNNIACIHSHFRSLKLTQICSDEISKLLATIAHLEDIFVAPMPIQEDYKVFLLNVCLFQETNVTAVPAPAA